MHGASPPNGHGVDVGIVAPAPSRLGFAESGWRGHVGLCTCGGRRIGRNERAFGRRPSPGAVAEGETTHFVVDSGGGQGPLKDHVQRLEAFEWILRVMHGVKLDAPTPHKLDIYLVHDNAGLRRVWPRADDRIEAFYSASDGDIFAVAIREGRDDTAQQHE